MGALKPFNYGLGELDLHEYFVDVGGDGEEMLGLRINACVIYLQSWSKMHLDIAT